MRKDTFQKTEELIGGNSFDVATDDDAYSKPGDLVIETGGYRCATCEDIEHYSAGEVFTECSCNEPLGWILAESEADAE